MKSRLMAFTALALVGVFGLDEAAAQVPNPRAQAANPLMPNLGVPYTNMQMARSMLNRGNRGRNRRRPASRPVIINNFYGGMGPMGPY